MIFVAFCKSKDASGNFPLAPLFISLFISLKSNLGNYRLWGNKPVITPFNLDKINGSKKTHFFGVLLHAIFRACLEGDCIISLFGEKKNKKNLVRRLVKN